jgi:curved DNA-binding protein CbpA
MDLYDILKVSPNCTMNEIKKSYYKLAKIHHPDKMNGNTETFQQINYAYNILINENSRMKYNIMNKTTKNKFISFMEKLFKENSNIKSFFNFSDTIFDNIDSYDFNDILLFFNNSIIPTKKNTDSIDCSDSDIESWDETSGEYYDILPVKYHQYNKNNICLELECNIDQIINNSTRTIKITRKIYGSNVVNTFYFNTNSKYIVFNMGGDIDTTCSGNLIILLKLPPKYTIDCNNIIYNYDISLYNFIYGIDININFNNKKYDIKQWIPYRDGMIINISSANNYNYIVKLQLKYNDNDENKRILSEHFI